MANKTLNPKLIAGYVICGVALISLFAFAVIGRKEEEKHFNINLKNEGSTYQTKLDAYKAKQKEENKPSIAIKSSAYNDFAVTLDQESVINDTPITKEENTTTQLPVVEYRKQITQVSKKIKAAEVPNEDYEALENGIKKPDATGNAELKITEKERRKQAMEASWGQVGTASNDGNDSEENMIKGVVYGTQEARSNQTARFRTTEEAIIKGVKIPKNTIINGTVSFNQNRLNIQINSIRVQNDIITARLQLYGSDGIRGLPVDVDIASKTVANEVSKEALSQAGDLAAKTGLLGKAIGGIAQTVAKTTKKEKDISITLIDNQMVIFRIQ